MIYPLLKRAFSAVAQSNGLKVCIVGSGPAGLYTAEKVRGRCAARRAQRTADCRRPGADRAMPILAAPQALRGRPPCGRTGEHSHWRDSLERACTACVQRLPHPRRRCSPPLLLHPRMQDRLPTPFGLVRSGVAPDHADTKVCRFCPFMQCTGTRPPVEEGKAAGQGAPPVASGLRQAVARVHTLRLPQLAAALCCDSSELARNKIPAVERPITPCCRT